MSQPSSNHQITVILVSYNTRHLLAPCLDSVRAALRLIGGGKVVVIDNASRDGSAEALAQEHPDIELILSPRNVGFGRANNLAVDRIDSPFVLLLNTDAFIAPDALLMSLNHMAEQPDCGILGARLVGRDGVLQPSCRYFPTPWNTFLSRFGLGRFFPHTRLVDDMEWDHASPRDCDWVPGCFYLLRKSVIDRVGLFDPRYFLYFEEVDHCNSARRAGWKVRYFPGTSVVHLGGESASTDGTLSTSGRQLESLQCESALLYYRKNIGLASVLLHLVLETIGAILLSVRNLTRTRRINPWGRWLRLVSTAASTRFGAQPTR